MEFVYGKDTISNYANLDFKDKIVIKSVKELSVEDAKKYRDNDWKKVQILSKNYPNGPEFKKNYSHHLPEEAYDINTYIAIRERLDQPVGDISPYLDEEKKFIIIYERICRNIVYDYPAAYPKGICEEQYYKDNITNARNLKNGLLYGKCVCAGYADILRTALSLVGIDACYVIGDVNDKTSNGDEFNLAEYVENLIDPDDSKKPQTELHAWIKVKINDKWYNADPTFDVEDIRNGFEPQYLMLSDKQMRKDGRVGEFYGPICDTNVSQRKINKIYGGSDIEYFSYKLNRILENIKYKYKRWKYNIVKDFKESELIERLSEGTSEFAVNNIKSKKMNSNFDKLRISKNSVNNRVHSQNVLNNGEYSNKKNKESDLDER